MKIFSFSNLYSFIAILIVYFSNAVFLGVQTLDKLLWVAFIYLFICILCRMTYKSSSKLFNFLFWLFIIAVIGNFSATVLLEGSFTIEGAGNISLGFLIFLAILGLGGIEIILFFSAVISLLIGGIWLNWDMNNFDLYFSASITLCLILIVLSVYCLDFKRFNDLNKRINKMFRIKFPVMGKLLTKSVVVIWSFLFFSMILISVFIFAFVPRSKVQVSLDVSTLDIEPFDFSGSEDYETFTEARAFGLPEGKWAAEFSSEIDLNYSLSNSLRDKKPRFYVQFLATGETTGMRYQLDDFYTKARVYDRYENYRWKASNFVSRAFIAPKIKEDEFFLFPLISREKEKKFRTAEFLEIASARAPQRRLYITAEYFLLPEEIYPRVFLPDFPVQASFGAQTFNPETEELVPTVSMPDKYWVRGYGIKQNNMQGLISELKTSVERMEYVLVGNPNQKLRMIAENIIAQARQSGGYVLFKGDLRDFDKVKAVLQFFQNKDEKDGFRYEITPPRVPKEADPVEYFITQMKIGNCTHFNTAAAILLRYLGIPTRIVAGYRGGNWDFDTKIYTVQKLRAHLWFEVCFSEFGWFRFDATPEDDRLDLIDKVLDGKYEPPKYETDEISKQQDNQESSTKEPEEDEQPEEVSQEDQQEEEQPAQGFSFISDFDSSSALGLFADFISNIFVFFKRFIGFIVISVVIFILFLKRKKLINTFKNLRNKSANKEKIQKEQNIIAKKLKLENEFREIERLLKRLGLIKKQSETWLEFAKIHNIQSILQQINFITLIDYYYSVRFGFRINEYKNLKSQFNKVKSKLSQFIRQRRQTSGSLSR